MFSPAPMVRLKAVVLERDKRAAMLALGGLGAMELVCLPAGTDTAPLAPRPVETDLARCDRALARIADLRRALDMVAAPECAVGSCDSLASAEEELGAIERRAGELLEQRRRAAQSAAELHATCEKLTPYAGTGIPLGPGWQSGFLHFVMGTLPDGALQSLPEDAPAALLTLPAHAGRQTIVAMVPRNDGPALEAALRRAGFTPDSLPVAAGNTTDTLLDVVGRDRAKAADEEALACAGIRVLAAETAPRLEAMRRRLAIERRLLEAERNFPRTGSTVLIGGWVPADAEQEVRARLDSATGGRCAIESLASTNPCGEDAPVLLRQPRILRPFAALVSAYGLPRHGELVPTLFVAVSYVVMFGMMFGDAGHGAVLAAAGLCAILLGRRAAVRDAGVLLAAAGASALAFGVAYGSYFGIPSLRSLALWRDPLGGDPTRLMSAAVAIGVAMISLGLVINTSNRLRRGDILGGLLGKFGALGIVFYWGALLILANQGPLSDRGLVRPLAAAVLLLPFAGWVACGIAERVRHNRSDGAARHGGIAAVAAESAVDAFEGAMSFLANTISFVRLAAYAMSHAAVLVATFMLASVVEQGPAGRTGAVVVVILGNAAAIALEGIVGLVQALRLEYYEFFGKFFSGAGRPFQPFALKSGG